MFNSPTVAVTLSLMGQFLDDHRRPGYRWPNGPICLADEHKAYTIPLKDYLTLIEQVERSIKDNDDASQRLRMMYYGTAVSNTAIFDTFLDSNEKWIKAPLTRVDAPQDTLDALMRYGNVDVSSTVGPPRLPIDIGHIWVLFDYVYNGLSWSARFGQAIPVVDNPEEDLSWGGDLGSWFQAFNRLREWAKEAREAAGATWTEPVATSADLIPPLGMLSASRLPDCSAEDLLSDIDAVVLSREIDKRGPADPSSTGTTPFASLLAEYYGPYPAPVPAGRKHFHSDNRFQLFVRAALPEDKYDHIEATGAVTLKPDAKNYIRGIIYDSAFLLLFKKNNPLAAIQALESSWGEAMLDRIAEEFTDFLRNGLAAADGWELSGWPTLPKALDEYGGSPLHIGSSDSAPDGPVRKLQTRLKEIGFTVVGTPDGVFGPNTAIALRELQIAATHDQVYARISLGPGTTNATVDAIRRYFGPIHGVLDEATADIVNLWYEPQKHHRKVVQDHGAPLADLARYDRIFNPVIIQTGIISGGVPTLSANSDVWAYDDVTTADAPGTAVANRVRFFAVDQIARYDIPIAERYAGQASAAIIGRYVAYQADGGPVVDQRAPQGIWNSTKITMANLVPTSLDLQSLGVRSTYRVLRAVAEAECVGHYDSVNCYDPARLSLGMYHWALQRHGVGELAVFLAFFKHHYPQDYHAHFGRFGILTEALDKPWNPADWNMDGAHGQAKLVGRLALYGLHNNAGVVEPYTPLPLGEVDAGAPTGIRSQDEYLRDYLRSWRVVHRVIMALRLSPELQKVQWNFAVLRLQTLLAKNWMTAVGAGPVVTDGATVRPARFGEVFTSEKAVAALLRWHVNRPGRIISGNHAVTDAVQAFTAVYGGGQVNLSNVPAASRDQRQRDLVTRLITQEPELTATVNIALNYVDPDAGALQDTAGSFQLFVPNP